MTRVGPLEFVPDVGYVEQRPALGWRARFDAEVAACEAEREWSAAYAVVAKRDARRRRELRQAKRLNCGRSE